MNNRETKKKTRRNRIVTVAAVLAGEIVFLMVTANIASRANLRGALCDGASVWCDGGEPTPAEWPAEMNFRSAVVFTSSAVAISIFSVIAFLAWRRRRRDIALAQIFPLLLVIAYVVAWTPYTPV